jgi:hypothetical protein
LTEVGPGRGSTRWGLAGVLLLATLQLVLFAALDSRPPNDHDPFYTDSSIPWVLQLRDASPMAWPGVLVDHFLGGDLHPRLAQTVLVLALGLFGETATVFRLANLPFVLLLVGGTWLLARELGVRRPALAAFAIATLPLAIHASRKWDLQFHAAALTPLGLWLAAVALRRRDRWVWAMFGAFQGLRLYSHPLVLPDVALTLVLVPALGLWRGRGAPWVRIQGPGLAVLSASVVGSLFLGVLGSAGWSLPKYLAQRGDYAQGWWWKDADLAARAGLFVEVAAEFAWLHFMPPLLAVTLFGVLCAALVRLRPDGLTSADRAVWPMLLVLVLLAFAQVPIVGLAVSNQAFVGDWLFPIPGLLVVAAWGLERGLRDHPAWGRGLASIVVLQGLLVVSVPLGLGALGPDLLERADFYDQGPLKLFVRSSSGRHYVTHHVPSRQPHPAETLAAAMQDDGFDAFEIYNLAWDPTHGGEAGCHLGDPSADGGWTWEVPSDARNEARRPLSGWPFVFAGGEPPKVVRPDGLQVPPAPGALRVVRLWLQPTPEWDATGIACVARSMLGPSFLAAARARIGERLGAGELTVLPDPAGQLVGRVVEWDRSRAYVGTSYLLRSSAPDVDLELHSEGGAEGAGDPGPDVLGEGTELREGDRVPAD